MVGPGRIEALSAPGGFGPEDCLGPPRRKQKIVVAEPLCHPQRLVGMPPGALPPSVAHSGGTCSPGLEGGPNRELRAMAIGDHEPLGKAGRKACSEGANRGAGRHNPGGPKHGGGGAPKAPPGRGTKP